MTLKRQDKAPRRSATHITGTLPEAGLPLAQALSDPLPDDGTVLALAAIAGGARIAEPSDGAAGLADAPHPGIDPRGRQGRAACRTAILDIQRCRVTWRLVAQLFAQACERDLPEGAARRRPRCHMRQIAMYLSHVVLSVPYQTIATAFGRDRTTVMHACAVVEDRRDDAGYDRFVEQCERCIKAVFAPLEHDDAEL